MKNVKQLLKEKLTAENYAKLTALNNPRMHEFIADSIKLCRPDTVFVVTDSDDDAAYVREMAITNGEEKALKMNGHTIHFDGMSDQGRDRETTKYLVPKTDSLSKAFNHIER